MPYIYTIEHPVTHEIVYVGKTNQTPFHRLKQHLYSHKPTVLNKWIDSLVEKGMMPRVREIDVVDCEEANRVETYWVHQLKSWGFNLFNINSNKALKCYRKPKKIKQ